MRLLKWLKNPYNILILSLAAINILPILAPIFLHYGLDFLAKPIYFLYSFTCHQFAHRSLHIHDHQCAWCTRDMAIWGSILLTAILIKQFGITKSMKWYWIFPFVIPIAMDGGIQTFATLFNISPISGTGEAFYISTNTMRAITGAIFGTGLGLWLLPPLYEGFHEKREKVYQFVNVPWRIAGTVIATILVLFVGMVSLWSLTSQSIKPANVIDFAVKTPQSKEFFVRREKGICPTNAIAEDPLALECFF